MNEASQRILAHLAQVAEERRHRAAVPALLPRVQALKAYQQERFRRTYPDLLAAPRYRSAALFFLHELYGPEDFTRRDEEFARIVAPLVRLFPRDIVATVEDLAALHALSESLDGAMACALPSVEIRSSDYVAAWQATGRPEARAEQIRLLLQIGSALDRFTKSASLWVGLRAMRGPARAAGLGDLQRFLESGFETFRSMGGADSFLQIVAEREDSLCRALFAPDAVARATTLSLAETANQDPLGQLP